jgi:hypothetical protein
VERRLLLLTRAGLLARHRRSVRLGEGSGEYLYAVTAEGLGILAAAHDRVLDAPRERETTPLFEDHRVAAAQVWAALAGACTGTPGRRLEGWLSEAQVRGRVAALRARGEDVAGLPLPDGTGVLVGPHDRRLRLYVEMDQGTATSAQVAAKMRRYERYLEALDESEDFSVLWVALGPRRMTGALQQVARMTASGGPLTGRVLGAVLTDVTPGRVLGPIWMDVRVGYRREL